MIPHFVTLVATCKAVTLAGVDAGAEAVAHHGDKLCWSEMKAKGRRRNNREPASCVLFEVWEINVRIIIIANGINSQTPKLQRALTWVLDELERNQKKGKSSTYNFQDDGHISSCPVVHV